MIRDQKSDRAHRADRTERKERTVRYPAEDPRKYPGMAELMDEHERLHHENDAYRVCAGWAYENRHDGTWAAAFDPNSIVDGTPTVTGASEDPSVPDFLYRVAVFERDEDGELDCVGYVDGTMTDDPTDGEFR